MQTAFILIIVSYRSESLQLLISEVHIFFSVCLIKSKDTHRAASNQDPALFQFYSAFIRKIQETSVFNLKNPEGTQCKFHFISAMLLCVSSCPGGGLPGECGATYGSYT